MSVNHFPPYRVIVIVAVIGIAFSALAWSGDNRLHPGPSASDSIPSRQKPGKKAPKPRKKNAEGRMARELDLRMDVDDMESNPPMEELELDALSDLDVSPDLDALKGLNARIEADELKNMDAWNNLDALKELDIPDRGDLDALDELNDIAIEEEDLQTLKELNIDGEIWKELKALKEAMDDLRDQLEDERAKGVDDYRIRREVEGIIEAVRAEIPRVRKEIEKALLEFKDSQGRQWQ